MLPKNLGIFFLQLVGRKMLNNKIKKAEEKLINTTTLSGIYHITLLIVVVLITLFKSANEVTDILFIIITISMLASIFTSVYQNRSHLHKLEELNIKE